MKAFFHLFFALNKEFYRDKGSLSWAFVLPVLIIIGCAVAFSNSQPPLLTVGIYPAHSSIETLGSLAQNYSRFVHYDELKIAKQRLAHHQVDAVIDNQHKQIWLSPTSSQSQLIAQLLKDHHAGYQIQHQQGQAIRYVDWVLPGVLGMNIMFGSLFGVGYVLVRYRKNGVLKRLKATPISALTFLSAQVASRLFIVLLSNAVIFIGSWQALNLLFVGHALDLLITAFIGTVAMIALALLIACRTASEELAGGLLNAATWPMMFLSGIWFSLDNTPSYMQALANLLPLTHLVAAGRDIMLNGAGLGDVWPHLLALIITSIVCLLLAARFFRWDSSR